MRMEMSVRIWLISIQLLCSSRMKRTTTNHAGLISQLYWVRLLGLPNFKLAKAGIAVCSIEITWAKNCSGDIAGPQRTDAA